MQKPENLATQAPGHQQLRISVSSVETARKPASTPPENAPVKIRESLPFERTEILAAWERQSSLIQQLLAENRFVR